MKKIETAIQINASPEAVWNVLVDFSRMDWNPLFASIEGALVVNKGLQVIYRKPRLLIRPRITACDPGRVLEWLGSPGLPFLFESRHRFELTEEDGGTRFRHAETFTGILVPLLGGFLAKTPQGFEAMNQALKVEAEKANAG
jgi:hypothetical protein